MGATDKVQVRHSIEFRPAIKRLIERSKKKDETVAAKMDLLRNVVANFAGLHA
jgi:hypothetical protein